MNTNPKQSSGIYAIANHLIGRVYIGQARRSFYHRWTGHRYELNHHKHNNKELQCDWDLFGPDAFDFVPIHSFVAPLPIWLCHCLNALERHTIASAECWLYNATKVSLYSVDAQMITMLEPFRL